MVNKEFSLLREALFWCKIMKIIANHQIIKRFFLLEVEKCEDDSDNVNDNVNDNDSDNDDDSDDDSDNDN